MPDFGISSLAIASHVVVVAILVLLMARMMRAQNGGAMHDAVERHDWAAIFAMGCVALAVERIYYTGARIVARLGVDLWQAHPAPEVLSLIVSLGLYVIGVPILQARLTRARAIRRVALEIGALTALWAVLVAVLY